MAKQKEKQRPNTVLQEEVRGWVQRTADYRQRLLEANIKLGYIETLVSPVSLDERILLRFADQLEKVTGINLQAAFFRGAKKNLWNNDDPLSEIVCFEDLLAKLDEYRKTKVSRLAREIGVNEPRVIHGWVENRVRMKTMFVESVLLTILRREHPEKYRSLYGEDERKAGKEPKKKPTKKGRLSSGEPLSRAVISADTIREAVDGVFGNLHFLCGLIEGFSRDNVYEPSRGEQKKAWQFALRLPKAFGIDDGIAAELEKRSPLTQDDLRLLGTLVGKQTTNNTGKGK